MGVTHALFKSLEDNLTDDQLLPGTPLQRDDNADSILLAQARFCDALLRLHNKHLIKPSTTMTLLRNFHNNVPVHRMRAAPLPDHIAQRWDNNLYTSISTFLDAPNTARLKKLIHLPLDLG